MAKVQMIAKVMFCGRFCAAEKLLAEPPANIITRTLLSMIPRESVPKVKLKIGMVLMAVRKEELVSRVVCGAALKK